MDHYVYLLRCSDGSFYTGYTTDPGRRFAQHSAGRGARYTRSRLPLELVYTEKAADRSAGLRREWQIRKLSHAEKEELARNWKGEEDEDNVPG